MGGGGEAGTRVAGLSIRKGPPGQSPLPSVRRKPLTRGGRNTQGGHAVHFCMCLPGTS